MPIRQFASACCRATAPDLVVEAFLTLLSASQLQTEGFKPYRESFNPPAASQRTGSSGSEATLPSQMMIPCS